MIPIFGAIAGAVGKVGETVGKISDNKTKVKTQAVSLKHEAYMAGLDYRKKMGSQVLFFWVAGLFALLFTLFILSPAIVRILPSTSGLIEDYLMIYNALGNKVVITVLCSILGIQGISGIANSKIEGTIKSLVVKNKAAADKQKAVVEVEKIKAGVVGDSFVSLKPTKKAISKVKRYIQEFAPYAIEVEKKYGLPANVVLAHSAVETQWNEKVLRGEDESGNTISSNSYFNIKVSSDWKGAKVKKKVHEYVTTPDGKKKVWVNSWFRAYPSARESFEDYGKLLHTRDRYKPLLMADDPHEYADLLHSTGYFTDKDAPEVIKKIMTRNMDYET